MRRALLVLKTVRCHGWLHFLPLPLLSAGAWPFDVLPLLLAVLSAAATLAFAYGLNDLRDGHLDTLRDSALRRRTGLGHKGWRITLAGAAVGALVCAAALNLRSTIAVAVSLGVGWAYSVGPRIKRFPVAGTVANVGIFAPLAFVGQGPENGVVFVAFLVSFSCLLLQNQLLHEVAHAEEDRREGVRTTTVKVGGRVSVFVSVGCGLAAAAPIVWLSFDRADGRLLAPAAFLAAFSLSHALVSPKAAVPLFAGRLRRLQRWVGLTLGALAWALVVLLPP